MNNEKKKNNPKEADHSNSDIIDLKKTLSRLDGDCDLLKSLISYFLEGYDNYLMTIRNSIAEENFKETQRSAHTFKGAVSNFNAQQVFNIASEIETLGRENNFTNINQAFDQLLTEAERLKKALNDYAEINLNPSA